MAPELALALPARAENVIVVRQAISGLAETAGMEPRRVADLKTVVSEACNNVVLHAYHGEPGPMEIDATVNADELEVTVRDRGEGFQPSASDAGASLGIGLPLIASLSDRFTIRGGSGEGTRLVAGFAFTPTEEPPREALGDAGEELRMTVAPGRLAREVLARVLGALAARAQFPVDRLSDTVLLGDAVSDHRVASFLEGRLAVEIVDGEGALDIRVGPLKEGGGERMLAAMEIPAGGSLRTLARSAEVRHRDDSEYLVLEVAAAD